MEDITIPPTSTPSDKHFRLLDLPYDMRERVLSHVLPSVPEIDCDTEYSPCLDIPRNCCPYSYETIRKTSDYSFFRSYDGDGYSPQILRVNRQLSEEGIAYLYRRKIFIITIYNTGYDFLKASGQLETLPPLPYHEIKEFVIRIMPRTLPTEGDRARWYLLWLCGLIQEQKVHFKNLRIDFTDQISGRWEPQEPNPEDPWDAPPRKPVPIWEYIDDKPENVPPEFTNDDYPRRVNFDYIAWNEGFDSSIAWLASPLRMLSGVADAVVVDLPRSCVGKPHYEELNLWYEEGLSGRFSFDEDDRILRDCRWNFKHPYGPKENCEDGCEECIEHTKQQEESRQRLASFWQE
ncbi:MAG: hypothetical protein Q9166_002360 [cf. Caloplaca sp. 2 TL-2023]